jgi:hypothetical protein
MKLTLESAVNAPRAVVWSVLTDVARAPQVLSGVLRVELVTEADEPWRLRPGARWRETRVLAGREHAEELAIGVLEPLRAYSVVLERAGQRFETHYEIEALGRGRSRVRLTSESFAVGWLARSLESVGVNAAVEYLLVSSLRALFAKDLKEQQVAAERLATAKRAPATEPVAECALEDVSGADSPESSCVAAPEPQQLQQN